jgi:hypothetical protein
VDPHELKREQRNGLFVKAYEELSGRKIDDNDNIRNLDRKIKMPKAQRYKAQAGRNAFFSDYNPEAEQLNMKLSELQRVQQVSMHKLAPVKYKLQSMVGAGIRNEKLHLEHLKKIYKRKRQDDRPQS